MGASGITARESEGRRSLAALAAAAVALVLSACAGQRPDEGGAPSGGLDSWLQRQQLPFSAGLGRMRERIDGALGDVRDNAGDALRRVRGRAIVASDACFPPDGNEGCAVAARNACRRASFADGAPLASSTYVACSGVWGMRVGAAPEGACKTKRRINAAICW